MDIQSGSETLKSENYKTAVLPVIFPGKIMITLTAHDFISH